MWFCIRPQIYNASAPHTCAWACASVHYVHFACYVLHIVHFVHIVHATHCILCIKVETHLSTGREIKDWHQSRCWKLIFECKFSNHVLLNKIPTFNTSCFNYIVFRYWRVAWLVDPDLKIHYGQHFRFYHPLLVRILIVLIVWSMIETVIDLHV